jgi:hypothetical protein
LEKDNIYILVKYNFTLLMIQLITNALAKEMQYEINPTHNLLEGIVASFRFSEDSLDNS